MTKAGRVSQLTSRKFYAVFFTRAAGQEQLFAYPVPIQAVSAHRDYDLALCRIGGHVGFSNGFPSVRVGDHCGLRQGDDVMTLGFPLGTFLFDQLGTVTASLTRGIISAVVPAEGCPVAPGTLYQLDLTATNGNSGGPVFLADSGEVFGVLQGGVVHTNGMIVQGLTRAEPVFPMLDASTVQRLKSMTGPPERGAGG